MIFSWSNLLSLFLERVCTRGNFIDIIMPHFLLRQSVLILTNRNIHHLFNVDNEIKNERILHELLLSKPLENKGFLMPQFDSKTWLQWLFTTNQFLSVRRTKEKYSDKAIGII